LRIDLLIRGGGAVNGPEDGDSSALPGLTTAGGFERTSAGVVGASFDDSTASGGVGASAVLVGARRSSDKMGETMPR
jgi:hypothetical protein